MNDRSLSCWTPSYNELHALERRILDNERWIHLLYDQLKRNKYIFMRSLTFYLVLLSCTFSTWSHAKNLALSFDDGLNPSLNRDAEQINQHLLQQLSTAQIKSIIFPSYIKIGDTQGKTLVQQWGEQGHLIGNHSAYHQNLNKAEISTAEYIHSIQINESIFKDLPNYVYLYRFPFLKEGDTFEKRNTVQKWLSTHHYQHGAVSIDASDWFYNLKYLAYKKANAPDKLARLKQAYLTHLLDRAQYYDELALQSIGRSPDHVLLLHTNAINGAFLSEIIAHFQANDWHFISAQQAFKDPLYKGFSQNLPAGESAIWSIAKSKSISGLRYPAEDAPYEQQNLEQFGLLD